MPQAKAVAKKYKLAATLYDFLLPRYTEQTLGAALKNISIASNQKILDIGCGTGALEEKLLEKFPQMEITALDVSPEMLKRARKKFSDPQFVPNRIQWLEGDFLNLQLPRQFFDTAFALSNFHYFFYSDYGCHRKTITHPLCKHRYIRLQFKEQMRSANIQAKTRGNFVND